MNNFSKILWGIVLIALGIVIGLNALNITSINLLFKGWWTLIIIIPCLINLFNTKESGKTGDLIGVVVGVALLLAVRDIISFSLIWKLLIPIILVAIGLSMIFNETIKAKVTNKVKEASKDGLESITATFASQKVNKDGENFKGANLDSVFGGVTLDLRQANIEKEAVIKASAIFGGVEIFVPSNINLKVKGTPIFGGVSNKVINKKENEKTIYIDAFCMFGGVDIK